MNHLELQVFQLEAFHYRRARLGAQSQVRLIGFLSLSSPCRRQEFFSVQLLSRPMVFGYSNQLVKDLFCAVSASISCSNRLMVSLCFATSASSLQQSQMTGSDPQGSGRVRNSRPLSSYFGVARFVCLSISTCAPAWR